MSPGRVLLDAAVELRAVAQSLEASRPPGWSALDALVERVMAATNAMLAVRDRTPGAPEPAAHRRHLVAVPSQRDPMRRYYVHGDRDASGDFYCKRCDLFMDREHFAKPEHGGDAEHARRVRLGHLTLRRMIESGGRWFRPADAESLFDGLTAPPPPAPRGGGRRAA